MGPIHTKLVELMRGVPQGAPKSQLIFILVTEYVLRPLLTKWKSRGSGWFLDTLWLSNVCYADDILLMSSSLTDLRLMLDELAEAFSLVGLEVSLDKTHWSSYPSMPNSICSWNGYDLPWERTLTFVGGVIDLSGDETAAINHRIAQATGTYGKWRPVLHCKSVSPVRRAFIVFNVVFSSVLWLSECWHPTKAQMSKLNSWAARTVAKALGVKPQSEDEPGDHWKRLHRRGHDFCKRTGKSLGILRRRRVHRWAGHLARTDHHTLSASLKTRCLAWWRFFQHPHLPLHPRRFGAPSRWESQLEDFYGRAETDDAFNNDVGWMAYAKNRTTWKTMEKDFEKKV